MVTSSHVTATSQEPEDFLLGLMSGLCDGSSCHDGSILYLQAGQGVHEPSVGVERLKCG